MKHHMMCLILLGVLVLVLVGCGGGGNGNEGTVSPGGSGSDSEPPLIKEVTVKPANLTFIGGTVEVTAEVTDNVQVSQVVARLGQTEKQLQPEGEGYRVALQIPFNLTPPAKSYQLSLTAKDSSGNEAHRDLTITQGGFSGPPSPE